MSSANTATQSRNERLIERVAHAYGISTAALTAPSRAPLLVEARRVAMGLLAERGLGPTHIGRALRRDHSTVLHHLARLRHRPTGEEQEMLADLRDRPPRQALPATTCIRWLTEQASRG